MAGSSWFTFMAAKGFWFLRDNAKNLSYTKKYPTEPEKKKVVIMGHPVGVGAPGTGVAPKVAPTRPLGFPTGT